MREAKRSACCSVSGGLTKNLLGVWKPRSGVYTERKMCRLHTGTPHIIFTRTPSCSCESLPALRLARCVFAGSGGFYHWGEAKKGV